MKKFLWVALFAVAASSCKDDDNGNVNINGTWVLVSEVYANCSDPDDNFSDTDDNGCDDDDCLTFQFANGTYTIVEYDAGVPDTNTGTYTLKGSKMTVDGSLSITVKRSGDTLTLTYDDEDECDAKDTLKKID
jgi:hypothetical protein